MMTEQKIKRIKSALADTQRFITREERYSPDLQHVELLTWYRAHALKLQQMLDNAQQESVRYQIRSYRHHGNECFKVIDTFNGGRVMVTGLTREGDAITRRDELNQFQAHKAVR